MENLRRTAVDCRLEFRSIRPERLVSRPRPPTGYQTNDRNRRITPLLVRLAPPVDGDPALRWKGSAPREITMTSENIADWAQRSHAGFRRVPCAVGLATFRRK